MGFELARKFFASETVVYVPNTFIGGIGATINTAALLATKLGVQVHNIKNFQLNGVNVTCYINPNIIWGNACFHRDTDIIYLISSTINTGSAFAYQATNLTKIGMLALRTINSRSFHIDRNGVKNISYYFPEATILSQYGIRGDQRVKRAYIPKVDTIINTSDGSVFNNMTCKVYVKPSMVSHPELHTAYNFDIIIVGIDNFTPPNPITDLTITPSFSSATFNFTPPTGSTNAIDFYEIWIEEGKMVAGSFVSNNKPLQKYFPNDFELTASGQTLTGLPVGTWHRAKLATVDIFYNGSGQSETPSFSNEIIFKTL